MLVAIFKNLREQTLSEEDGITVAVYDFWKEDKRTLSDPRAFCSLTQSEVEWWEAEKSSVEGYIAWLQWRVRKVIVLFSLALEVCNVVMTSESGTIVITTLWLSSIIRDGVHTLNCFGGAKPYGPLLIVLSGDRNIINSRSEFWRSTEVEVGWWEVEKSGGGGLYIHQARLKAQPIAHLIRKFEAVKSFSQPQKQSSHEDAIRQIMAQRKTIRLLTIYFGKTSWRKKGRHTKIAWSASGRGQSHCISCMWFLSKNKDGRQHHISYRSLQFLEDDKVITWPTYRLWTSLKSEGNDRNHGRERGRIL